MQPVTPPAGAAPAARNMRIFHLQPGGATELAALPDQAPAQGFVWISCTRATLQERLTEVQRTLQLLSGQQLVDLHVSDLLNAQLPSRYDYTSQYDLLVFRRLASGRSEEHTSELQSPCNLVCRLLLEKKKNNILGL